MSTTYQISAAGTTAAEDQTEHESRGNTATLNPAETALDGSAGEAHLIIWAIRLHALTIPAKAKILKVKLEIWLPAGTANNKPEKAEVSFYKEPKGCAVFEAKAKNLSARSIFKSNVSKWEGALTAGAFNALEAAGLAKQLEELVAETGWTSGNAVGLQITPVTPTKLTIENYAGTHEHAAKLTVEYEGEGAGGKTFTATATVKVGVSLTDKAIATTAATSKFREGGSTTDKAVATTVGTAKVRLAASATDLAKGTLSAKAAIATAVQLTDRAASTLSAKTGVSLTAKATDQAAATLSAKTGIALAASESNKAAASTGAVTQLTFTARASVPASSSTSARTGVRLADSAFDQAFASISALSRLSLASSLADRALATTGAHTGIRIGNATAQVVIVGTQRFVLLLYDEDLAAITAPFRH